MVPGRRLIPHLDGGCITRLGRESELTSASPHYVRDGKRVREKNGERTLLQI